MQRAFTGNGNGITGSVRARHTRNSKGRHTGVVHLIVRQHIAGCIVIFSNALAIRRGISIHRRNSNSGSGRTGIHRTAVVLGGIVKRSGAIPIGIGFEIQGKRIATRGIIGAGDGHSGQTRVCIEGAIGWQIAQAKMRNRAIAIAATESDGNRAGIFRATGADRVGGGREINTHRKMSDGANKFISGDSHIKNTVAAGGGYLRVVILQGVHQGLGFGLGQHTITTTLGND